MTWSITQRFPSWGETGESPPDNFFYEQLDRVNEKHLDYLWNSLDNLEDETRAALQDIDSDQDGTVDEADSALAYKGNDIDTDGDGSVDSAETVKGNDIDTDGDGVVDAADTAAAVKGNDIDSDGDGVVDAADTAAAVKGNDIDTDGDGVVDKADETVRVEARTSDPSNPVDGQIWVRTDL